VFPASWSEVGGETNHEICACFATHWPTMFT
jgi:hypothetical protein